MVTSRQLKEKVRDYRRSVKHSWLLFKESRIGVLGLAIMTAFVIMALISPYMGLRDPMDWWAPDVDVLRIDEFFSDGVGMRTDGPFIHGMDYRVIPAGGASSDLNRIYAAGGDGSLPSPYGVYSYDPDTGRRIWTVSTDSMLSTKLVLNNFGSEDDWGEAEQMIFFGCENGRVYAMKDGFGTAGQAEPSGNNLWSYPLDGAVVGQVAYYQFSDSEFNNLDMFFASSDAGTLYAFEGPTPEWDPVAGSFNDTSPTFRWSRQVANISLTAPTASADGLHVFVGTVDGELHGFDAASGQAIPEWSGETYQVTEKYWSTAPLAIGSPAVVYSSTSDGMLHAIWGPNGTMVNGWTHFVGGEEFNGLAIGPSGGSDGGNLTELSTTPDGSVLLVGSTSGYAYTINAKNASVNIAFNTKVGTQETQVITSPYYDSKYSRRVFITARNLNDTSSDPSDDFTLIYCMASTGNDTIIWRKTLEGVVLGQPFACINNFHVGQQADVGIATVYHEPDGTAIAGKMYSFSAQGYVITPLPPHWIEPSASGNDYWLGTDAQGHDILSQTVLGSRIALLVGFLAAGCSIGLGVIVGLVSGYYGKGIDALLMRFTDVILVLPALPLLITFAAIMSPSIWNIIIIIAIIGWGGVARVIRSEVLSLKERPFIDAARVTGASKSRIMFRHIAPNVLPLALLYMTFAVSGAILFEAALSFIGLGDPGTMTWGMMLNYVQHSNALSNWWWLLPPGLCITLVCMAFFLLGRAFDEIVNPRLRRRK